MDVEYTLSIIKPDAVRMNVIGKIYERIESHHLKIIAAKMKWLTRTEAEVFYAVHKSQPFFAQLIDFMTSGPTMIQVLAGEGAVLNYRQLMGATNPKEANKGTLRADFATSVTENAVHGSDSLENAKIEIAYFFSQIEQIRNKE